MLISDENKSAVFLRPRHTDKKLLESENTIGCYDGIHMGTNMPTFLSQFVKELGKNAFSDPVTYLFALPVKKLFNEAKKIKPSIRALGAKYGQVVGMTVGYRPLRPNDFLDDRSALDDFVRSVCEAQIEQFGGQQYLINPYYEKYAKWASAEGANLHIPSSVIPNVVIPPYFYFGTHGDDWYKVSLECAKSGLLTKKKPVFPALLFSKKILSDELAIHRTVDDYLKFKFDGFFIWPNDFNEEDEKKEGIVGLIKLIKGLSKKGLPIIKFYGSYFSALLYAYGLKGFSCGLGYGVSKNAFATSKGGGKFEPKYYVPRLHRSLELEDAERLLSAYSSLRCKCRVCNSTYGKDMAKFSLMRQNGYCEAHFLRIRHLELKTLSEKGVGAAIKSMEETIKEFEANLIVNTNSLKKWLEIINSGI